MRGNLAMDGKFLMLIDGIEMNERNYGGFAELGVINIITSCYMDIHFACLLLIIFI